MARVKSKEPLSPHSFQKDVLELLGGDDFPLLLKNVPAKTFMPSTFPFGKTIIGIDTGRVSSSTITTVTVDPTKNFALHDLAILDEATLFKQQGAFNKFQEAMNRKIDGAFYRDMYLQHMPLRMEDRELTATQKLIVNYRSYLRPLPILREGRRYHDSITSFVWGPHGEWTGYSIEEMKERHDLERFTSPRWSLGYDGRLLPYDETEDRLLAPRSLNSMHSVRAATRGRIFSFPDHAVLSQYHNYRQLNASAESCRIAGALQVLIADSQAIDRWASLMHGEGTSACGVLRDGDGNFDAFGILAHHNGAEWEWDEEEQAWMTGSGDPTSLSREELAEVLNIPTSVSDEDFAYAISILSTISDESTTLHQFGQALNQGNHLLERLNYLVEEAIRKKQMHEPMMGADGMRYYPR